MIVVELFVPVRSIFPRPAFRVTPVSSSIPEACPVLTAPPEPFITMLPPPELMALLPTKRMPTGLLVVPPCALAKLAVVPPANVMSPPFDVMLEAFHSVTDAPVALLLNASEFDNKLMRPFWVVMLEAVEEVPKYTLLLAFATNAAPVPLSVTFA